MIEDKAYHNHKLNPRFVLYLTVNGDDANRHPFFLDATTSEQAEEEADSIADSFLSSYKQIVDDNETELIARGVQTKDVLVKLQLQEIN
jgi:hypothetical protein